MPRSSVATPDWLESARAALRRAIIVAGGQTKLADGLSTQEEPVTQGHVTKWLNRNKKGVPAHIAVRIEENYGIPKHEIRPDVFAPPAAADGGREFPAVEF